MAGSVSGASESSSNPIFPRVLRYRAVERASPLAPLTPWAKMFAAGRESLRSLSPSRIVIFLPRSSSSSDFRFGPAAIAYGSAACIYRRYNHPGGVSRSWRQARPRSEGSSRGLPVGRDRGVFGLDLGRSGMRALPFDFLKRLIGAGKKRELSCEPLPAFDRNVDVAGVDFDP